MGQTASKGDFQNHSHIVYRVLVFRQISCYVTESSCNFHVLAERDTVTSTFDTLFIFNPHCGAASIN